MAAPAGMVMEPVATGQSPGGAVPESPYGAAPAVDPMQMPGTTYGAPGTTYGAPAAEHPSFFQRMGEKFHHTSSSYGAPGAPGAPGPMQTSTVQAPPVYVGTVQAPAPAMEAPPAYGAAPGTTYGAPGAEHPSFFQRMGEKFHHTSAPAYTMPGTTYEAGGAPAAYGGSGSVAPAYTAPTTSYGAPTTYDAPQQAPATSYGAPSMPGTTYGAPAAEHPSFFQRVGEHLHHTSQAPGTAYAEPTTTYAAAP